VCCGFIPCSSSSRCGGMHGVAPAPRLTALAGARHVPARADTAMRVGGGGCGSVQLHCVRVCVWCSGITIVMQMVMATHGARTRRRRAPHLCGGV
jgi:hypothetical protein